VLQFSAEVARILDSSPASVNSALQRQEGGRPAVPTISQQAELDALGAYGHRELVDAFVAAWERADVAAILDLLAEDARFTMPPLPA
jgi:RNA polymerase sigma-70 factor (ECF subfamily)